MSARDHQRCAIYTRVSSDGGLEQDFNSLDAQREAAEAYIKSQAHEGWRLRRERYDDGGFSGGSMERPALRKLLADVAERQIDIVVVYKVDRLTRSLADFAKLVDLFDKVGVSFVSVTQSFNTTSSMGRLTLNVLLSFAQFEREITGERIRDKIAASKKKGIWMGGTVPLGYRVESRKLLVEEAEAAIVRLIFRRYLELGSLPALQRELRERGIRTRLRVLASGTTIGGVALTNGPLSHLLKNRMYLGEINHRGISYKGEHAAMVDPDLFAAVQARLTANLNRRDQRKGRSDALLTGCIFDDRGNPMSPSHAVKKGVRYRYYVSAAVLQGRKAEVGSVPRVPGPDIERAVLDGLGDRIAAGEDAADVRCLLTAIKLRVTLGSGHAELTWTGPERTSATILSDVGRQQQSEDELFHESEGDTSQRLIVPFTIAAQKRRREIIFPTDAQQVRPMRSSEQQNLLRSIAQGRTWLQQVVAGSTISGIAARENRTERLVRMTVSLAFLDPELVHAVLHGRPPRGASVRRLVDPPASWHEQWQTLGLSRPA